MAKRIAEPRIPISTKYDLVAVVFHSDARYSEHLQLAPAFMRLSSLTLCNAGRICASAAVTAAGVAAACGIGFALRLLATPPNAW